MARLQTPFTKAFDLVAPIVLAPMAGAVGSELAAAVARAGGLAMLAGLRVAPEALRAEYAQTLELLGPNARKAVGIGLGNFMLDDAMLEAAITLEPTAIWLSHGDFKPWAPRIKEAGIKLICQIQTLEDADEVVSLGADAVVAQGVESGGHGATNAPNFTLVPEVVDRVAAACAAKGINPIPVLAAGGVTQGRHLAAALMLGADGVVMGTRLAVTRESLFSEAKRTAVVEAPSDASAQGGTMRSVLYDQLGTEAWPSWVTGRHLRNNFAAEHDTLGHPLPESKKQELKAVLKEGQQRGDTDVVAVYAGSGVGSINSVEPAGEVLQRTVAEAAELLKKGAEFVVE